MCKLIPDPTLELEFLNCSTEAVEVNSNVLTSETWMKQVFITLPDVFQKCFVFIFSNKYE